MILDLTTTKYSIIMCKEDDERGEKKMYLAGMQLDNYKIQHYHVQGR